MNDHYITINNDSKITEHIEKSKFISQVFPVETEEEAINILHSIKKTHYKATHNVYAYIIGEKQEIQKCSDDGEPSGTAGVPILEIIKKENLTNILIIVTRYFGGIKLGAGGLIRAYAHMAKAGIDNCERVKNVLCEKIKITIDYSHWGKIENECNRYDFDIHKIEFLDKIYIDFYLQEQQIMDFNKLIQDITNGEAIIQSLGKDFIRLFL